MSKAEQDLAGGFNIFGQSIEAVAASVEEEVQEGGTYVPHLELNPQGNQDSKDLAVVRLIPSLVQGNKNIVKKISYKVNSDDGKKFYFDSKKSLGWRENDCAIADMYDKVKDDAAKLARFKTMFNYKKPSTVLVQVLKYDTDKSLVGRILPLRIQEDVEKLITSAITPSKEDVEMNDAVANNVYDLFTGKALMLNAGLKTIGQNADKSPRIGRTFEDSKFVVSAAYKHFLIPRLDAEGNKVTKTVDEKEVLEYDKVELSSPEEIKAYETQDFKNNPELYKKLMTVLDYLKDEDTPKVEDYGYNEPSEERQKWVSTLTEAILSGSAGNVLGVNATSETPTNQNGAVADENVSVNSESSEVGDAELAGILDAAAE